MFVVVLFLDKLSSFIFVYLDIEYLNIGNFNINRCIRYRYLVHKLG